MAGVSSDSDEEQSTVARHKRRIRQFSDSDSEPEKEPVEKQNESFNSVIENETASPTKSQENDHDSTDSVPSQRVPQKSRLRKMSSSGEDTDSDSKINNPTKNVQDSRIENKRKKLKDKFKTLHMSKHKDLATDSDNDKQVESDKLGISSEDSDEEEVSVKKISLKIKEKSMALKTTICDPDTSDEENDLAKIIAKSKKKPSKSTKPTSPKPIRMSAKQAMENMHKIKSESNRMLREKEVSLPYHRPKALSLKDIMSRRKPALSADGKSLPIKMNSDQLRQYALLLEQRQKEMMELCKSESEEEAQEDEKEIGEEQSNAALNDTLYDNLSITNQDSSNKTSPDDITTTDKNIPSNINNVDLTENTEEILSNENNTANELNSSYENRCDTTDKDEKKDSDISNISNENNEKQAEDNSMEIDLVYNDSVEEDNKCDQENIEKSNSDENISTNNSEKDSQLISLHYDSERIEINSEKTDEDKNPTEVQSEKEDTCVTNTDDPNAENAEDNEFSDSDMNLDDIDALIANAEIISSQNCENVSSPMLVREVLSLNAKPKLTGAPGMVIDLDGTDPLAPKKLTGVELLKERFTYFAKFKNPEELEREKERRIKPGSLHLKLKQELEDQIAEQRSLEWAKRLEEEKQKQKDIDEIIGDGSDAEDDIDKIESKLNEEDVPLEEDSSQSEEEELEPELVDKPRKRNPMVDDEAEESDDCDDVRDGNKEDGENQDNGKAKDEDDDESEEESSEESEESGDEDQDKPRKGRILKAFEDSDDEDSTKVVDNTKALAKETNKEDLTSGDQNELIKDTQDEDIQLAQKSLSEDMFSTEGSQNIINQKENKNMSYDEKELGTQTFSILETTDKEFVEDFSDKLTVPVDTQNFNDNLDEAIGLCSGSFSQTQNLVPVSQFTPEVPITQSIGEDVLALCTGQFYDNQFVSQVSLDLPRPDPIDKFSDDITETPEALLPNTNHGSVNDFKLIESQAEKDIEDDKINKLESAGVLTADISNKNIDGKEGNSKKKDPNLKSILDELNDPEFDSPKPSKYFDSSSNDKENKLNSANNQYKKKFTIDSDEEESEEVNTKQQKKKSKRRRLEQRALQISDDEDEEELLDGEEEMEEIEEDADRLVEYDSDENEVIVQPKLKPKKKRTTEFFEQEAELTSEDEWVGSGDEDERGLDRMEREEGDDDKFNQNQLQHELGQIHMRDVLDQDKREVRLIQELLFEDGDLGAGSRQRKFRWRNADGEEEAGGTNEELADTQEEEFESEEQWRKQRHEREMFLKSLNNEDGADALNINVSRSSLIKANLSKNSTDIFVEVETSVQMDATAPVPDKKTAKDIPSARNHFSIMQQNYHGSLLSRGRGALERLAALATPLTNDDDTPKVGSLAPSSKRNFVFATIEAPTAEELEAKVTKRKADSCAGTPRLVKKMKTEDKPYRKSSLLDHLKT